ncbi:MAG: GAF domain-containing protein [Bacteroidetes bacterium]|nr:GAF domain-containing protein [Bacteroidota bacterium]
MNMDKKEERYKRVTKQIEELITKTEDPLARMSTIIAILHHKFDYFFWTGFYRLINDELIICCYQGSVACLVLNKHVGVCWAAINKGKTVIVPDVNEFPGHMACDSQSKSEIVIPVKNKSGDVVAVLDVDSKALDSFDEIDAKYLKQIVDLIYK